MRSGTQRLVIVSNRLPFTATENGGKLSYRESTGGLVTGLRAYLEAAGVAAHKEQEYIWVGWPGGTISEQHQHKVVETAAKKYRSFPVFLTQEEMDAFYLGFCNKTIWPLFHYLPTLTEYNEEQWQQYRNVNAAFGEAVMRILRPDDVVWVHDYHLMLLPAIIKHHMPQARVGFFLHIPFPDYEVFRLLPGVWRREILEGLVGADQVGFHTFDYTQHFLRCVLRILGHENQMGQIVTSDRVVKAETFPMGIHVEQFQRASADPSVQQTSNEIRAAMGEARVVLSVDRLDYTKGILHRLQGFEILLERYPEYIGKVVLLMVVVPSRGGVEQYDLMKKQIEEQVGRINGRFGAIGWSPIVYQYTQLSFLPLVGYYRVSDVALVTPLRDGMNLVAKEYIASRTDNTGVLILSEMAGAAKELAEAVVVNPNNRDEIAEALREALTMPAEEQVRRNTLMRSRISRYTVVRWASEFIGQLKSVPEIQDRFYAKLLNPQQREVVRQRFQAAAKRSIFLDYDGTLVTFFRRPQDARPAARVLDILRRLATDKRNSVTVISGRDRATLEQWLGAVPVTLVAEHGIWWKSAGQPWEMFKQMHNAWKLSILPIMESFADRLPGSFVEEKEYSVVWHYRAADPEHSGPVAAELLDHLTTFTANIDVQVMKGHKIVEVRVAGVNKGSVAQQIILKEQPDFVLAAGDDWTDEDLFQAVPADGVAVKVGIANTRASHAVLNVEDVLKLLESLLPSAEQLTA